MKRVLTYSKKNICENQVAKNKNLCGPKYKVTTASPSEKVNSLPIFKNYNTSRKG
jgi:hypothetical protein